MNEQENKAKSVPLLIYENEMRHKTNTIKGLLAIIGLFILVFGITICLFMKFISSYDYSNYNQNGDGINNLNNGKQGDIINESKINNKN